MSKRQRQRHRRWRRARNYTIWFAPDRLTLVEWPATVGVNRRRVGQALFLALYGDKAADLLQRSTRVDGSVINGLIRNRWLCRCANPPSGRSDYGYVGPAHGKTWQMIAEACKAAAALAELRNANRGHNEMGWAPPGALVELTARE